jgi:hypothetical protein
VVVGSGIAKKQSTLVMFTISQFMPLSYRILALLPALFLSLAIEADTNKAAPKAPEQKFQAILVWATDDDKPPEKEEELKAVEPELKEKIKFLKWKNYFQVGERKTVAIRAGETQELELSHKCKLKLKQTEKEGLAVELIGENKSVIKKNQTMPLKDILIIGGEGKDATGWLVVLRPE